VEELYKKHGPLALIGSRTKLMQHWADRIDHWLDPKKVMPIKGGAQGYRCPPKAKVTRLNRVGCAMFFLTLQRDMQARPETSVLFYSHE
jgi:hypothetical protein